MRFFLLLGYSELHRELGLVLNSNQSITGQLHVKDCVEMGHLIMFDTFRVNRDQVMDLENMVENPTNVGDFETASPKT